MYHISPCLTMAGHGWLSLTIGDYVFWWHSWPWLTVTDNGWLWKIMSTHVYPLLNIVYHGSQCLAMFFHGLVFTLWVVAKTGASFTKTPYKLHGIHMSVLCCLKLLHQRSVVNLFPHLLEWKQSMITSYVHSPQSWYI